VSGTILNLILFLLTFNLDGSLQQLTHSNHVLDPCLGPSLDQYEVPLLVENDVLLLFEVMNGLVQDLFYKYHLRHV
jgi:hypothetical protein